MQLLRTELGIANDSTDVSGLPDISGKAFDPKTIVPPSRDICDFGEFRQMIYPPYSLVAARTRESMRLHLVSVKPPPIENWQPLIVIANTKSGSNTGAMVISLLRGLLHPLQVMEMSNRGPHEALQWVAKTSPTACRILIAGGDGTISWVLNTIYRLNIKVNEIFCIIIIVLL